MRFAMLALAASAACGTDITSPSTDGGAGDPDGNVVVGNGGSDGSTQTICEQAAQHADLAWIQSTVFTPQCARGSCHDSVTQEARLDLSTGAARASLVNQPCTTQSSWIRVVPGKPDSSYLMVAIGAADGPRPVNGIMPIGSDPLCDEQRAAIGRWISAGAPE